MVISAKETALPVIFELDGTRDNNDIQTRIPAGTVEMRRPRRSSRIIMDKELKYVNAKLGHRLTTKGN